MKINYVDNLSSFIEDRLVTTKTQSDFDYIRSVRASMDMDTGSHILKEWRGRYDNTNIRRAKNRIAKLDNVLQEGLTIHKVNPERFDRASISMREYCGLNPVTRKRLVKQTLDLPHTDKLIIGKEELSHNFKYREVMSGVSTHYTKTPVVYCDAEPYMEDEDRLVVLSSWERMLKNLKNKQDT